MPLRRWPLVLALLCSSAQAAEKPPLEQGSYQVLRKPDHTILWHASWTVRQEGIETVVSEQGQGRYHGAATPVAWQAELRVRTDDPAQLRWSTRTVRSLGGSTVAWTVERRYDPASRLLTTTMFRPLMHRSPRLYRWVIADALLTPDSLASVIRHRLAQQIQSFPCTLVTDEPALYRVTMVVRGEETITVPAGTFRCWKVELVPRLGLMGWLGRAVIPKTYLWHTVQSPYYWIRYEGLESGLRSAEVVMELSTFAPPIPPTPSS